MFVQSPPQPPPSPHAAAPAAPFTPHEHALFVEGVEVFCNQSGAPVGDAAWRHIAAHVRTRTPDEIKAHAQYYLMSLQSRNPEITRVPPRPARAAARGRRAGTRAAQHPSRARDVPVSLPRPRVRVPLASSQARVDGGHVDAGVVAGGEQGLRERPRDLRGGRRGPMDEDRRAPPGQVRRGRAAVVRAAPRGPPRDRARRGATRLAAAGAARATRTLLGTRALRASATPYTRASRRARARAPRAPRGAARGARRRPAGPRASPRGSSGRCPRAR